MGARVVNLSFGGAASSRAERDAIAFASRTLFVAAAGNDAEDNDAVGSYPCEYELPNVLCVAATDRSDDLAAFSNFGATTVDLGAPGVAIAATWPGDGYALLDGSSMAAPFVTGVAALLFAREPAATVAGVRRALLAGVDAVPGLAGRTVTGGRLNAAKALAEIAGVAAPVGEPASRADEGTASDGTSEGGATEPPAASEAPSQSAPATTIATPAALPDRSAPLLTVRRRGRRLRVRCSERCTLRLSLRRGRRVVWSRALRRRSAGWVSVAIPRKRAGRYTLRLRATDAAGNRRTATRRLRYRRR
jgi:subtilisin family serine protease